MKFIKAIISFLYCVIWVSGSSQAIKVFDYELKDIYISNNNMIDALFSENKSDKAKGGIIRNFSEGIILSGGGKIILKENERIIWYNGNRLVTEVFIPSPNGQSLTKVISYKVNKEKLIKEKVLEYESNLYPLSVQCINEKKGIIIISDATEGGGERKLHFYTQGLSLILEYEPFSFDYQYTTFSSWDDKIAISFNHFQESEIDETKIIIFDANQQDIVEDFTLPINKISAFLYQNDLLLIGHQNETNQENILAAYKKTGEKLWEKSFSEPINQIDIVDNEIYFRGKDLHILILEKGTGNFIRNFDLLSYYPLPLEYNSFGLAVSFFNIQICHSLNENYLVFVIPKLSDKGESFSEAALIFYNRKLNTFSSSFLKGRSKVLKIKDISFTEKAILYGKKIFNYDFNKL